ncbi:MAG: hypothetical protein JWQ11_1899 [Rhizobacter sp.]|nr:hypothetical protein [Rhizobacter sp.]
MSQLLVGVFDRRDQAQAVVDELMDKGFSLHDVEITANTANTGTGPDGNARLTVAQAEKRSDSIADTIGDMFKSLFVDFGGRTEDEALYDEAIRRGSVLLTVHAADDGDADIATRSMHAHGSVDVDSRADTWRADGWTGSKAASASALPAADTTASARADIPATLTPQEMDTERTINALPLTVDTVGDHANVPMMASPSISKQMTPSALPEASDGMIDGTSPLASAATRDIDVLGEEPQPSNTGAPHGVRAFKRVGPA